MSDNDSLTARTSWLVCAKTLSFVFAVAVPLVLVRRLPQQEFGLYKQVFLVIQTAVGMLPLGFGMTAFYFLPREARHRQETVLHVVMFTGAVGTLFAAVLTLFPSLLVLLFREPAALAFAPWIGLVVVLWVVGAFLEIVTVANHEIKVATASILAIQVTRALFLFTAAVVGGTVRALVAAAIAQGLVQVGALTWYLRSRFPGFWRAYDLPFFKRQLAYALPFGVAGTLYSLQLDLHNYFVSHQFGAAVFAVYAVGCFQVPLFGILTESVGSILIPRVSLLQHEQRTREIVLLTARVMRKLAAVYFPAYAFLMVMRHEFIVGLFTTRYLDSVPIFAVNLTLIPLGIFLLDPIMRAHAGHRHFLMKLHAAIVVGLALALPLAIGRFGLVGAIGLVVLAQIVGRGATFVKAARILEVRVHDVGLLADVVKIAVAAGIAAVMTMGARALTGGWQPMVALAACGVWFAGVYVGTVLTLGIVTAEEQLKVRDAVSRLTGLSRLRLAQAGGAAQE